MAGNNGIQFLRGNSAQRANSTQTLLPGQPFYETDTTRLYIGGTSDVALKGAAPVMAWANASGFAYANGPNSIAMGSFTYAYGNHSIAMGSSTYANSNSSIAIGESVHANSYSIAIGGYANADSSSIAIGESAHANSYSTAIGGYANASNSFSTAIGRNAYASGSYSIAMGYYANANSSSIAIGRNAYASGSYSIAIGYGANASSDNTIALGNANTKTITAAVTTITKLSDERTKEDIESANTAQCLVDVNRLPVKRFKYKKFARFDPRDVHITEFIAQDAQKVFPKSILVYDEEFPELDENGEPILIDEVDENGQIVYEEDGVTPKKVEKKFMLKDVLHMDTNFAVPTLWAAVQELTKITKAQQEKIDELEERIKKLEK